MRTIILFGAVLIANVINPNISDTDINFLVGCLMFALAADLYVEFVRYKKPNKS